MASRYHNRADVQKESVMDEAAHEMIPKDHMSSSSYLGLLLANPSNEIGSDMLHHANGQDTQSILLGRQLCPVIYTRNHFEDLGLGAVQYAKAMLERHAERGIIITRRDIERHWRRQVRREYNRSHPLWFSLRDQLKGTGFIRFWNARGGPQNKKAPATCLGYKPNLAIEPDGKNSRVIHKPAAKPMGKYARRKHRKRMQMEVAEKDDASQDTANRQSRATMKAEEDMERALQRLDLQGAASQDTTDQPTALPDYEIAEAEIQWKQKISEASVIKPGIQPQEHYSQRPPGSPGLSSNVFNPRLRNDSNNDQDSMDWN